MFDSFFGPVYMKIFMLKNVSSGKNVTELFGFCMYFAIIMFAYKLDFMIYNT